MSLPSSPFAATPSPLSTSLPIPHASPSGMAVRRQEHLDRCLYPSKICRNPRVLKTNGTHHRYCQYHRYKANVNQKRWVHRRRGQAHTSADEATTSTPRRRVPFALSTTASRLPTLEPATTIGGGTLARRTDKLPSLRLRPRCELVRPLAPVATDPGAPQMSSDSLWTQEELAMLFAFLFTNKNSPSACTVPAAPTMATGAISPSRE